MRFDRLDLFGSPRVTLTLCTLWIVGSVACGSLQEDEPEGSWELSASLDLPEVDGRIDHLTCDLAAERLFVAALGNGSLERIDLAAGRRVASLGGLAEPQGLVVLPAAGLVAVATGGDGALHVIDVHDPLQPKVAKSFEVGGDADNLRWDERAKRLYVGVEGGLAVVDTEAWALTATIPLEGHAESFQLETASPRIFVNVPAARHVAVVDRTTGRVESTFALSDAGANYPMALDESNHRLFVACRRPGQLLVLDTRDGRIVATLDCADDCDDLFYDASRQRIYATCGTGVLRVFRVLDVDHYAIELDLTTAPGARTGLFVPERNQFLVAVPHRGSQRAQIQVWKVPN